MRVLLAAALLAASAGALAETVRLEGQSFAVFNLAGSVRIETGAGPSAVAEVTLAGPDADLLSLDTLVTEVRGERATALVVRYPDDDVVYREVGWRGRSDVKVASDGTFHRGRGKRIRLRSSGNGTEAHANIVLRVPPDQQVSAYLAMGEIRVADAAGDFYLDTHHGAIIVDRVLGDITADTGSGDVRLEGVNAGRVNVDTGSGDVLLENVSAERLRADTGSGEVVMRGLRAEQVIADTGSGDVEMEFAGIGGRVSLDTGSGDVRVVIPANVGVELDVDTGSGRIASALNDLEVLDQDDDKFIARRGGRELRLSVDTGSGDVSLTE